jgi:hypothetical protein
MATKKETSLEWMKSHPDIVSFQSKSQRELAEIYCDWMANSMWHRMQTPQATPVVARANEPRQM